MEHRAAFEAGIKAAGGQAALAEAMGESIQTISNWKTRGVPPNKCKAFEALTGVSVRELRPHDWREFWPEDEKANA